jgi:riboflavin synthase
LHCVFSCWSDGSEGGLCVFSVFAKFQQNFRSNLANQPSTSSALPQHSMVFTGIVEEMGTVVGLVKDPDMQLWDGSRGEGWVLTVSADITLSTESMYVGVSIAVNGTCLTATSYDLDASPKTCAFGLSPETLRRTNLHLLATGDLVNMERSMKASARNSGHFVQGHVDGVGTIVKKWTEGDSLWIRVQTIPDIIKYVVPKGYIAVDGTSLTVCEVNAQECWFTFMLVEYTQKHIVVPLKKEDGTGIVNLEVDVLGKYVDRSMANVLERLNVLETNAKGLKVAVVGGMGLMCLMVGYRLFLGRR